MPQLVQHFPGGGAADGRVSKPFQRPFEHLEMKLIVIDREDFHCPTPDALVRIGSLSLLAICLIACDRYSAHRWASSTRRGNACSICAKSARTAACSISYAIR